MGTRSFAASVAATLLASCSTAAPPAPVAAPPSSVSFSDTDTNCGNVAGTVIVKRAADETHVDDYVLYWGTTPTAKLDPNPIAVLPKTGADVVFDMPETPLPDTARFVLAFSSNTGAGESKSDVAAPIVGPVAFADVTAGLSTSVQGPAFPPVAATLDTTNGKLLVLVTGYLIECDLDGSNCLRTSVPGDIPVALAIDSANAKLLIGELGPKVAVCNLDGTACNVSDISAGQTGISYLSDLAIDTKNAKLVALPSAITPRTARFE